MKFQWTDQLSSTHATASRSTQKLAHNVFGGPSETDLARIPKLKIKGLFNPDSEVENKGLI
jgi:hypothetical protein